MTFYVSGNMIKNLIFDFGDVLINLDKLAVPQGLAAYGTRAVDGRLEGLARRYEKGQVSTDGFLAEACEILQETEPERLIALWNQTIRDFPDERLVFLESLKRAGTHRMFLLSNTNELHIQHVEAQMGPVAYNRFKACFEGFYLSHEMGLRKPEPEIFAQVLHSHGLQAGETLFIDDTLEHIRGASSLGIHTWHLQVGSETILELPKRI
jgi:putative hydrolase of the HAD superfamily